MNGAQERAQLEARSLVSENLQRGLLSAPDDSVGTTSFPRRQVLMMSYMGLVRCSEAEAG